MANFKKISVLFLLYILCFPLQSTNCSDRYIIEEHVTLGICKNYARGMEQALVYYKGAAKALNDYIALRVKRGELENKRFEIYMLDPILTRPHYSLTQSSKAYYIQSGTSLTLDNLMKLVDEFAQPEFTAIDMGIWDYENHEKQEKALNRLENRIFNKKLSQADVDSIKNKEYVIFQKNDLKVIYKNDNTKSYISDVQIECDLIQMPVIIRDRYIFLSDKFFSVYQDSKLIKRFESDLYLDSGSETIDVEVLDKWVNFYQYYEPVFSYSYDKNRFYSIEND